MRTCPVCARGTIQPVPTTGKYTEESLPRLLDNASRIPLIDVEEDLAMTQREIRELKLELKSREEFAEFLVKALAARQS